MNDNKDEPTEVELDDLLLHQTQKFTTQRLVFWAIRWTIGFAVIWYIVSGDPQLFWLWWVAGPVAMLSLTLLVGGEWFVRRKISKMKDQQS